MKVVICSDFAAAIQSVKSGQTGLNANLYIERLLCADGL